MKIIALLLFAFAMTPALAKELAIEGLWKTESEGELVRIELQADGTLKGFGATDGTQPERYDVNNPDPALRSDSLLGREILWNFKPVNKAKTEWEDGRIYDPNNGKTYSCKMKLKDKKLHIRGYIGISLIGRTAVWTKASDK